MTDEFAVCRERTPEEDRAVREAEVTRYLKVVEESIRDLEYVAGNEVAAIVREEDL